MGVCVCMLVQVSAVSLPQSHLSGTKNLFRVYMYLSLSTPPLSYLAPFSACTHTHTHTNSHEDIFGGQLDLVTELLFIFLIKFFLPQMI